MTIRLTNYDIVTRAEWGARPPSSTPVIVPWSQRVGVAYHYSAGNRSNGPRNLQNYAMDSLGYGDSHYNFAINASLPLVNSRGIIYEMRGATVKAAHASDHNTAWIGVCVIGQDADVTSVDLAACAEMHIYLQHLAGKTLQRLGHGQLPGANTSCPGSRILNWLGQTPGTPIGGIGMSTQTGRDVWGEPVNSPSMGVNEPAREWLKWGRESANAVKTLEASVNGLHAKLDALLSRPVGGSELTPAQIEAIAAAISSEVAPQVVDLLRDRLES